MTIGGPVGGGMGSASGLNFGSLNDALAQNCAAENFARSFHDVRDDFRDAFGDDAPAIDETVDGTVRNVLRSAGPISDAYILGADPMMLITGPGGSGKTTASVKKSLVEAQRIWPGSDGIRRYVLGVWRQKYVNLWTSTIPQWWKILPKDLPGSKWVGAPPRHAEHVVRFEDEFGPVILIARFRAFGDIADPQDLLGNEFTDVWLNEWPTLPEELCTALVDRVGREPPFEVIRRHGRFFGDGNAPGVLNYTFRDFYEAPPEGYRLYRQPGGRHPDAENVEAMGRGYWEHSARMNAHRPWWVKRMVDARPGFDRANDPVYPTFDDERNVARETVPLYRDLPVLVGVDNPLKPAACYMQERYDGQLRILAEMTLERGGLRELADGMLALEASARFAGCEFRTRCDPSMVAGEDTKDGSARMKLAGYLGREVDLAPTNDLSVRIDYLAAKLDHNVEDGPGLLIDPSCKGVRRGMNQTYHYRDVQGTNDRGSVAKTADSHVVEAAQYGASFCGSAAARHRKSEIEKRRQRVREENRKAGRFNPVKWAQRRAG